MNYQERMKEIRTYHDIKQKDFAKILNISPYTYSHYETGDATIPIKHLIKFCDYFRVSLDYILKFSNNLKYNHSNSSFDILKSSTRLKEIRKQNKLTQKDLAKQINIAQTMITEYEKGHFLISLPSLYTICKNYNISADYLLGKIDYPKHIK